MSLFHFAFQRGTGLNTIFSRKLGGCSNVAVSCGLGGDAGVDQFGYVPCLQRKKLSNVSSPLFPLSAIFGLVYRPRDFASYILGIFICNLLLYLAFYIIMKVKKGDVAVSGLPASEGEGIGLLLAAVWTPAVLQRCMGRPLWGLGWDKGLALGRGCCAVVVFRITGLHLPGVGNPSWR